MIKFVSTINVSVTGGGGGSCGAINNQWREGDLTAQSRVIMIDNAPASGGLRSRLSSTACSLINTLNKQCTENTQGYFKLHPYHAEAKASSAGKNLALRTKQASLF